MVLLKGAAVMKKLNGEKEVRVLLVLPQALDKNHPLHVGYVLDKMEDKRD